MRSLDLILMRDVLGLTNPDLARWLEISTNVVDDWTSGRAPIPPAAAAAIRRLEKFTADTVEQTIAQVMLSGGTNTQLRVYRSDVEFRRANPSAHPFMTARWMRHVTHRVITDHRAAPAVAQGLTLVDR